MIYTLQALKDPDWDEEEAAPEDEADTSGEDDVEAKVLAALTSSDGTPTVSRRLVRGVICRAKLAKRWQFACWQLVLRGRLKGSDWLRANWRTFPCHRMGSWPVGFPSFWEDIAAVKWRDMWRLCSLCHYTADLGDTLCCCRATRCRTASVPDGRTHLRYSQT